MNERVKGEKSVKRVKGRKGKISERMSPNLANLATDKATLLGVLGFKINAG